MPDVNWQTSLPAGEQPQAMTSAAPLRKTGKMLVPLLGVLAVLAMAVAGAASVLLMNERENRLRKEQELQLAIAQTEDLQAQLDEVKADRDATKTELSGVRRDLMQSKEDLAKAIEAQTALSKSIEDREQEIGRLTKEMDHLRSQASQMTAQLDGLQRERDTMQVQLGELERAKGELESKVLELASHPTVELEKVLVTNEPGAAAGSALPVSAAGAGPEGQVVVVNREYDFIVMNLGRHHGLSVGQEFQIVRGNEVLGKVKVEKIYDELSAAAILPESKKEAIREGDLVRPL